MNFLSLVMFGVVFAHAYCSLAKTDWFKYRLEEPDCDEADQVKCETSIYWAGLCSICRECYNVCNDCRDNMIFCKQVTAFSKAECQDETTEVHKNCPKTCGHCTCQRSVKEVHHNWKCQQHFKRVAKNSRSLHDEL